MILFINACVRKDSRTKRLTDKLLSTLEGSVEEVKLSYVTTAGGNYVPEEYGFGYVKALAEGYYGIEEVEFIKAVGLDIVGVDVEGIMKEAEKQI